MEQLFLKIPGLMINGWLKGKINYFELKKNVIWIAVEAVTSTGSCPPVQPEPDKVFWKVQIAPPLLSTRPVSAQMSVRINSKSRWETELCLTSCRFQPLYHLFENPSIFLGLHSVKSLKKHFSLCGSLFLCALLHRKWLHRSMQEEQNPQEWLSL